MYYNISCLPQSLSASIKVQPEACKWKWKKYAIIYFCTYGTLYAIMMTYIPTIMIIELLYVFFQLGSNQQLCKSSTGLL